jgi:uncharacterized membrane protein (GlpM family)
MSACDLLLRAALGGTLVSLFAAIGSAFEPKTFAGLFGAAPPIALASLAVAFRERGAEHVALLAKSMLLGALALLAYSICCVTLLSLRGLHALASAALAWTSWGLVAGALFVVFLT